MRLNHSFLTNGPDKVDKTKAAEGTIESLSGSSVPIKMKKMAMTT